MQASNPEIDSLATQTLIVQSIEKNFKNKVDFNESLLQGKRALAKEVEQKLG
jgi:hypothetical protein